jgi:hypothetical protein
MTVEYDCWKCGEWHLTEFANEQTVIEFATATHAAIRDANTKALLIRGGNG